MASNKVIKLVINQVPQPQPRPRVTVRGKYAHAYESKKIRTYKKLVAHKYRLEHAQKLPTDRLPGSSCHVIWL